MGLDTIDHQYSYVNICTNLFNAYEILSNQAFQAYVNFLKSEYSTGQLISPNILMSQTEQKYDKLLKKRAWKLKRDDIIVSLNTTFKKGQQQKFTILTKSKNVLKFNDKLAEKR